MKRFYALIFLFLFSLTQIAIAQQGRSEEIVKAANEYFSLERENIHAHFNKSIFLTNESIWFKGYVFHRKKNMPFFTTINIYASLINDKGQILENKLLYGNIGTFSGSFKLGSNYNSGKYYVQFYTNWMNNFIEDESSIYEITIINPEKGAGNMLAGPDMSSINIDFSPEGGTFVSGINNTIGLHISDCNYNPLPVTSADIVDKTGKLLQKVQLNKLGYGKFELSADNTDGLKAVVSYKGEKFEKELPPRQPKGIALDINSFSIPDNVLIKIKTNKTTTDFYEKKSLYLLIHQDNKATVSEFILSPTAKEQVIAIANNEIADGLNTIRILDSNLLQIAERIFFKYPKETLSCSITTKEKTPEKLHYAGKVNYPNMSLSISVLPENTISFDESNDIYGSFMLLPFLDNSKKASGRHYFTTLSKGRAYELDLFLLSQTSKYKWHNILQNPPKHNYPFDMGVTLKGSIPGNMNTKSSRIRLYSLTSGIDEITDINENREFRFDNLVIPDSSYVNFSLLTPGVKPKELTLAPQVLNINRKFNKPFQPVPYKFAAGASDIRYTPDIFREVTELEEVEITGTGLKYANSFGNGNLRGYKITDQTSNNYFTLINYIKAYGGFRVDDRDGLLTIYTRTVNSLNAAQAGPIIYLDNVQLLDYSLLTQIFLGEVDEIYMSSTAIVPSVRNYIGMIKIYLKKGAKPRKSSAAPEIIVKNTFERVTPFENVTYNTVDDKGFANFGVIHWIPSIMTNEEGEFNFNIPRMSAKPIRVLIEGFSADGKLISEIKTISN